MTQSDDSSTSTTSTTEVPRIVGEPLADWVVYAAGLVLLVVIVIGGVLIRRKMDRTTR